MPIISNISRENVENVVKPPQNPTVKASFKHVLISILSINNTYKKPIMKPPKRFTNKVANGKLRWKDFKKLTPIKYLITAPLPPPIKIEIIFIIIHLLFKYKKLYHKPLKQLKYIAKICATILLKRRNQMTEVLQYETTGTCCKMMQVKVNNGIIEDADFLGGCNGNLQGIKHLIKGMKIDDVIEKLKGIQCGSKPTSCPDQLAQCLIAYKSKNMQKVD